MLSYLCPKSFPLVFCSVFSLVPACGADSPDNSTEDVGTGGVATGTGGSGVGGAPTGGLGLGGILTGGSSAGGAATGGQVPAGGVATGGQALGGTTTGGIGSGGSPTGGAGVGGSTGGLGAGGIATGGVATGGVSTGGITTGGVATGGVETGGTLPGGAAGTCAGPAPGTSGQNPLIPEIYTADPAVLVHGCTFYITAGHDQGATGFTLRDWYVLSSTDMVNWSYNGGPVMGLDTFGWSNANAWASQMVAAKDKFYWYVPIAETTGAMAIGVAVADSPLGPFTDAIGEPLVNDAIEMAQFGYSDAGETVYTIDPTVFVDDDGQAYLAYGGFWRLIVARLGDDMISIDGAMTEATPPDFFEAPYLTKRDEIYYLIYAAGSNPATIDYVMADGPTGPWRNHGRVMDALPNLPGQDAATSHPAIAEFAGQWYLVYHLSDGPGGGTYRRQVAIEKLDFNSDGTIQQVAPSSGLAF